MTAPAEDAPGIPLRPVASAIWALFASLAAVAVASAQSFDPASAQVLQAYSPPLDGPKTNAARAGLNLLLPNLLVFPDLLPNPPSGSSSFGSAGFYRSITIETGGGGSFAFYSNVFVAASDADLAAFSVPTLETPRNSAIVGISVASAKAVNFYADVAAELSSGQRVHAFGVGMRYRW